MTRDSGFLVADVDVLLYGDAKVQRLARLHSDLFAIAMAGYLGIVLACWARGEREQALDAWPAILPWSPEAVTALEEVGLLADGRLPETTWTNWYGAAFERRESIRARWRRAKTPDPAPANGGETPRDSSADSARSPRGNAHPSVLPTDLPSAPRETARGDGRKATPRTKTEAASTLARIADALTCTACGLAISDLAKARKVGTAGGRYVHEECDFIARPPKDGAA